jgi:UDP-N-acetylmuramyl tripeptide synthase
MAHLGVYSCPSCGAERPEPVVAALRVVPQGMSGSLVAIRTPEGSFEVRLPLPGLYNVYNALGAATAALRLGVPLDLVKTGLESVEAAFGRVETIDVSGTSASILLIKNPAGANEVLRTLRLEGGGEGLDLWIALNDGIADGRDVSWVWDADFELLEGLVRTATCAGTRAPEMALRLKYAGWPQEAIEVEERIDRSLDSALARSAHGLFCLPTYTALLELRDLLADRGLAERYWA